MSALENSCLDSLPQLARDFKAGTDHYDYLPDVLDNPGEQGSHQGFYIKARDWQLSWVFEKGPGPQFKRLHNHLLVTWLRDLSTATAKM